MPFIDNDDFEIPETVESIDPKTGIKTVTSYKVVDDISLYKVVSEFQVQKKTFLKSVADRKKWKKYGFSAKDKPGPAVQTTSVGDNVNVQFVHLKQEKSATEKEVAKPDSSMNITCRYCKGNHWSQQCQFKDQIIPDDELNAKEEDMTGKSATNAYIPPSQRNRAPGVSGKTDMRSRDEYPTVRVTNLPEETTEQDIRQLFGVAIHKDIVRVFLQKDKTTGYCRGFAYVSYRDMDSAKFAINNLDGHRYNHLILKVSLAQRPANQT